MIGKGTFIRPTTQQPCNPETNAVAAAIQLLNEDPSSLKPGDPLYDAALRQYNQGKRAPNTDRLPIPTGFCGFLDPQRNVWIVVPVEDIIRDQPNLGPNDLTNGAGYPPDKCLQFGPPGSIGYDICGGIDPFELPPEALIPRKSITANHVIISVDILDAAVGSGVTNFGDSQQCGGAGTERPMEPIEGQNGFLWKPDSESRPGHPVVLLPSGFTGHNNGNITKFNGDLTEYRGVHNGCREHYYGLQRYSGSVEVVTATTGFIWKWVIPDASQRYDGVILPTKTADWGGGGI